MAHNPAAETTKPAFKYELDFKVATVCSCQVFLVVTYWLKSLSYYGLYIWLRSILQIKIMRFCPFYCPPGKNTSNCLEISIIAMV